MTAGEYLRGLRRAAHVSVPEMAIRFGQPVMVIWNLEAGEQAIPDAWVPLLAVAYRADVGKLADLLGDGGV